MTDTEIKTMIKELDQAFKLCKKNDWRPTTASYYAGMKSMVESLGFEIVTNNGKHKLIEKG